MKYELLRTEGSRKFYRNEATGTQVSTSLIHTDKDGVKWFGFDDLFKIPTIRLAMSRHISDLYSIGLSLKDILHWCDQETSLLKSNDPEKYEKLYALILEKKKLAQFTADPVRQTLALCTVYIMTEEEPIDYFDEQLAENKLLRWLGIPESIGFFLHWHNEHIQRYIGDLNRLSQTVSTLQQNNGKQPSNS